VKKFLSWLKNFYSKNKKAVLISTPIFIVCLVAAIVIFAGRGDGSGPMPDQVTITYANWNLGMGHDNALELRMLQSFMNENPHIRVDIDTSIISPVLPWMDGLATAAAQNTLPDVFMIDDLGTIANNGWLMDITGMARYDMDFFDLPRLIQEAVLINHAVYALPFAQDIHGYYVNRDLYRALGHTPPAFGISGSDFMTAIRTATDFSHPSIGVNHTFSFVEWHPGAVNPSFGFLAYNGIYFALNSPEMAAAVALAADIYHGGYSFNGITPEAERAYFPVGYDLGAFRYGQMGMFYGGAWLLDILLNQVDFDWDFIGVPGGRAVSTLDIVGISAYTSHPEEAYLLARWMGHGTEGNLRRLQYSREMGIAITTLPVTQNSQVLDVLWEIIPAPGLREVYSALDRVMIDGLRVLPGYMQARFSAPTGISIPGTNHTNATIEHLLRYGIIGGLDFPAYSAVAEDVARQQLAATLDGLRNTR